MANRPVVTSSAWRCPGGRNRREAAYTVPAAAATVIPPITIATPGICMNSRQIREINLSRKKNDFIWLAFIQLLNPKTEVVLSPPDGSCRSRSAVNISRVIAQGWLQHSRKAAMRWRRAEGRKASDSPPSRRRRDRRGTTARRAPGMSRGAGPGSARGPPLPPPAGAGAARWCRPCSARSDEQSARRCTLSWHCNSGCRLCGRNWLTPCCTSATLGLLTVRFVRWQPSRPTEAAKPALYTAPAAGSAGARRVPGSRLASPAAGPALPARQTGLGLVLRSKVSHVLRLVIRSRVWLGLGYRWAGLNSFQGSLFRATLCSTSTSRPYPAT